MTISKLCDGDSIIMPMKCFWQTGGRGCYTVNQDKCVFPFQYKGQKFSQCTTVGSNRISIYKKKSVPKKTIIQWRSGWQQRQTLVQHKDWPSGDLRIICWTALDGKDRRINSEFGIGLLSLILKSLIKSLMPEAPVSDFCIVKAAADALDGYIAVALVVILRCVWPLWDFSFRSYEHLKL